MTIYTDSGDNVIAKRRQRIRDAADGVTSRTISDNIIDEKLEKSDRWLEAMTGKAEDGWVETNDRWQTALEASENRTASKLPGIAKDTYDKLERDYLKTIRALNNKDSENQNNTMTPIAEGVNITNDLDPGNYTPDQDVFP